MEFPIIIDPELKIPLYRQLTRALRDGILSGRVKPGQQMPSTRQLSESLGISRDTAARSYEELLNQGLIQVTRRGRTYVHKHLDVDPGSDLPEPKSGLSAAVKFELSEYSCRINSADDSIYSSGDVHDIHNEVPPIELMPARQWREIVNRQCRSEELQKPACSSSPFGYAPLRESITSYLKSAKAVKCHSEQLAVFSSAQYALDLIGKILISPGDSVAVENPGCLSAQELFKSCGARIHPVSIDQNGLSVEELKRLPHDFKLVYLSPAHHGPAGIEMSLERRKELVSWAEQTQTIIIEDASDSDYRFGYRAKPALQALSGSDSVIFLYSFWKVLYPFSAAACLVLPPALVDIFSRAKLLVDHNAPTLDHYVLTEFIDQGHLQRHLRRTRKTLEVRRQALIYALAQNFKTAVIYPRESAGLFLRVRFELPVSDQQIVECANQAGLLIISTGRYYAGKKQSREYLMPFSSISEKTIYEKVAAFCASLAALSPEKSDQASCLRVNPHSVNTWQ